MSDNPPLLYRGMAVKVKNPELLSGCLADEYQRAGWLYITAIYADNAHVLVSSQPSGIGLVNVCLDVDELIPVNLDHIRQALEAKERELQMLQREISSMKKLYGKTN